MLKFGTLTMRQEHWRLMCLETCDSSGFSCLTHSIDCVTDANRCLQGFQVFIQRHKHAWVHTQRQVVEEVVVRAAEEGRHVRCREQSRHQTR